MEPTLTINDCIYNFFEHEDPYSLDLPHILETKSNEYYKNNEALKNTQNRISKLEKDIANNKVRNIEAVNAKIEELTRIEEKINKKMSLISVDIMTIHKYKSSDMVIFMNKHNQLEVMKDVTHEEWLEGVDEKISKSSKKIEDLKYENILDKNNLECLQKILKRNKKIAQLKRSIKNLAKLIEKRKAA